MAERVIAKLRRKVPKFALMIGRDLPPDSEAKRDVVAETFEALRMLGHSDADARRLIDGVIAGKKKFNDVNDLLQAIYEKSHAK
jgi:Holliday junction DNA helicase RuvA